MLPKALGKFRPRTSESRRIPLEREISFRVPRFENFVTEYSANISATGMFVRTREPLEPGTDLTLEFKVADDWKLIRGRARVIWVRSKDEGPEAPAGMGVRFLEMDPQSRRLIHWMVDKHAREGGETFEFESLRQTADQALGEAFSGEEPFIAAGRGSGYSGTAHRAASARRLALVVVALGLLGLLSWLFLRLMPPEGNDGAATEPVGSRIASSAVETPTTGDPFAPVAPTVSATASSSSAAKELVNTWADAWSEGRVEEYLSYYSNDFTPANGLTRGQWRASRTERLSAPQHIRVSITALEVEVFAPDRLRVTFFQHYRSDRFQDTVRKRLEMGLEADRWRILEERVVG
jgi:uncharacterized protein (TIGR02266 family)